MIEIWKDVVGYEGLYAVSNLGNVKSFAFAKETLRKLTITRQGYKRVRLRKNSKGKIYFVHRLVAEAFIPNPDNLPIINHKDENKANNCINNLEWCTRKYNTNYGNARLKMSLNHKKSSIPPSKESIEKRVKKLRKAVLQFDLYGNFIKRWESLAECTSYYKCSHDGIGRVCRGNRKTYIGFVWKYAQER